MEQTETGVPSVRHDVLISVRLDYETLRELDRIALFEHEKRAALARRFLIEKVQTYLRNPIYKRFLKLLEEKAQREQDRESLKAERKKWE